jgi:nicotinamide-nucleotide amidase
VEYTILSNPGLVELIFRSRAETNHAQAHLDGLQTRICQEFGDHVYSTTSEEMAAVVGRILARGGLMLATAESCTGGAVSRSLTDVAGSSNFFVGGVISYSDRLKEQLLGVRRDTLDKHGAVSSETAIEMAAGVCRITGAEVGISVTGIAGPGGGSPEKPVGTVWFGFNFQDRSESVERRYPGDRASVRMRATHFALDWLRRQLLK